MQTPTHLDSTDHDFSDLTSIIEKGLILLIVLALLLFIIGLAGFFVIAGVNETCMILVSILVFHNKCIPKKLRWCSIKQVCQGVKCEVLFEHLF